MRYFLFLISVFYISVLFSNDRLDDLPDYYIKCSGTGIDYEKIYCGLNSKQIEVTDFSQLGINFSAVVELKSKEETEDLVGFFDVVSDNGTMTGEGVYMTDAEIIRIKGDIKGIRFNGKGELIHMDGDLKGSEYRGDLKNNLLSGEGVWEYASDGSKTGAVLTGTFENDGPIKGIVTSGGEVYKGEFNNETWSFEGYGVYEWPDGARYEGEFLDGREHGFGIYEWADGERYEGNYISGTKQGYGEYFYKNGDIAKGNYENGQLNGPGEYLHHEIEGCESHCEIRTVGMYKNGQVSGQGIGFTETGKISYQGEYRKGIWHGWGIAYDEKGFPFYAGDISDGEFTGKGKEFFYDGSYYEGGFKNGIWHGNGVQFSNEFNKTFVGKYEDGSLQGPGTIITKDYRTEGNFEDGLLQGQVKTIWSDGMVSYGEFDKGEIISYLGDSIIPEISLKRVALVIGNDDYMSGPLDNAVNDSMGIKIALEKSGFEVIHKTNATKEDFLNALWEFRDKIRQLGTNSSVASLFYYAGHASQVDGVNFLNPVDTIIKDESDLELESINARKILNILDTNREGIKIMILDACRNNPFKSFTRSTDLGLAQMDAPSGTFIAYSTSPGKVALDGSAGNYSFYTGSLISNIAIPGMTIEEVFKNTRRDVVRLTSREQIPWEASSLLGDFYFQKN